MDVSIMIEGQDGLTWDRWKRIVEAVEDLGFAGLFRSDHFTNANPPDKESLELWVSLTYLADHTERIRFGQLVSPVSFRHPIYLARQANALNDLSGGRMILGMGAGWQEREHTMFGFELGDIPTRMSRLSEALEVASRLLAGDEPVDFEGRFFNLKSAVLLPAPVERPLLNVGGNGPQKTLPLVARYAQVWNGNYLTPEDFKARSSRLDELLKKNGRSPEEVKRTMMIGYYPQMDEVHPNLLSGSPEKAADQLQVFEDAGLQEVMVQWFDHDDIDGLKGFAAAGPLMSTHVEVFYDYTCGDAFRFKKLLDLLPENAVEVHWKAYSLREHQRTSDEQSIFERGLESFALLALALAQALPPEGFGRFHDEVYDAINLEHRKMEREDLFHIAEAAGLDRKSFEDEEDRWLELIKGQHEEGKTQWNSLGTPTVIFGGDQAVYIEISDIPSSRERAQEVWREIETIAASTPEVREIKRSV